MTEPKYESHEARILGDALWQWLKQPKQPCGECHIQPGETCDICGARAAMARNEAYDKIDRYLRNNLDDADYAEYSTALEIVWRCPTAFDLWVDRVEGALKEEGK